MPVDDLVDGEPAGPEDRPMAGGRLQRLCRVAQRDLTATGVGTSLIS
jgi:hypothetical protein